MVSNGKATKGQAMKAHTITRPGAAPYIERSKVNREGNRVAVRLYLGSDGVYRALGRKSA